MGSEMCIRDRNLVVEVMSLNPRMVKNEERIKSILSRIMVLADDFEMKPCCTVQVEIAFRHDPL